MTMTYSPAALEKALKRAEELKAKAKSGNLSDAEIDEVTGLVDRIEQLKAAKAGALAESKAILDRFGSGSAEEDPDLFPHVFGGGGKGSGPRTLSGANTSKWASTVGAKLRSVARSAGGQKGVISGDYGVPIALGEVRIPEQATTLLDLLPRMGLDGNGSPGGNTFSYVRQTVRTNNAAVVPDNTTKPTSVYQFEEVEDKFQVIAHLSDPIVNRMFADAAWLDSWLAHEMQYGIQLALEQQVLYGTGYQNDEIGGIFAASGLEVQDFDSDLLTTCRKAITKLESTGIKPSAFVFSPLDAEAIDLAESNVAGFHGAGPFVAGPGTLWGVPRVTSTALNTGTAILADWQRAELLIRDGSMTLAVDTSGDLFEKNLTRLRVEGRFGFALYQAGAFVRISTGQGNDSGSSSGSGSGSGSGSA